MAQDLKRIIYGLHRLERNILPVLLKSKELVEIARLSKLSEAEVRTGLGLLDENKYVNIVKVESKFVRLDKFGKKYVNCDLPEIKFLNCIINSDKKMSELTIEKDEFSAAIGILKKNDLVGITKESGEMKFSTKKNAAKYLKNSVNNLVLFKENVEVEKLSKKQKETLIEFKQRKGFLKEFIKKSSTISLTSLGKQIAVEIEKKYLKLELVENLTGDMLKSGSWKNKEFRGYDINVDVPILDIGRRHPMLEANNILRDVFVEMGFSEMEGPMVESAFWNMDTMWIPQDHPARDEQDTFYLKGKAKVSKTLMNKVRKMHEVGINKSHTLKGEWSEDITCKRLLRTHSTATTFRTLHELGKKVAKGENVDGKYFYLANVFRNEAIDATHLAEFYQAEGFIIADNLSLADLMGFIKEYYAKLGIDKIRFKPTFNPYTEPSMEAHYYDEKLGKWYALINSGIFRPETLEPMGLKGKTIIAWGIGASRVAALLSGKESMRDITGATCDFEWLKTRPIMTRSIVKRGN